MGQGATRLAQLRHRRPGRQDEVRQARPRRDGHQAGAGDDRGPAGSRAPGPPRRPVRGGQVLLLGCGERPRYDDDEVVHPARRCDAHREGALQHRVGLRLRVRDGGRDEGVHEPLELLRGAHGDRRTLDRLGRPDGEPARRHPHRRLRLLHRRRRPGRR